MDNETRALLRRIERLEQLSRCARVETCLYGSVAEEAVQSVLFGIYDYPPPPATEAGGEDGGLATGVPGATGRSTGGRAVVGARPAARRRVGLRR